ncbi:MAG TPA: aldehyde ferredoxin oxidoreductase family protein [Anaerolineae bacterium]|nr:aldehyde ferredoxin oxidoreductase family protein [Anaerolineae bacterium]
MNGYMGKLLVVDLSRGELRDEPVDEATAHDFVGGAGYAARYLYSELKPGTDPMGPANTLMFMTGPLVGTHAPSCGRHEVCALSPLTGIWGESNSGGFWGAELRFSGYDGIAIRGQSERPVWLSIIDGQPPALHDASDLWGLDTYETQARIREELGDPKVRVASIGPASENLVLYGAIMNDHGRAAGRTGMGTVMGSKKLKAIAVRGRQRVPLYDKKAFEQAARRALEVIQDDITVQVLHEMGSANFVDMSYMWGNLPIKYWTGSEFDDCTQLSGVSMSETILTRAVPCFGCSVACGREITLKDTRYGLEKVDGPEYETVAMLGSLLMVSDLPGVAYANYLCNRYGLDTVSAGGAIGLSYLLYERGILTADDTGGMPLRWGDIETAQTLIEMIAHRKGFGNVLAEGTKRMAAHYGAEDLAVQVNGLDLPGHDPRAFSGMGAVYATSPRGACHQQGDMYMVDMGLTIEEAGIVPSGRFKTRGKARVAARTQDWRSLYGGLIMCNYVNPTAPLLAELLGAATGWPVDVTWCQRTGERIFNLKRAVNNRLGVKRGNDRLPRALMIPLKGGSKGRTPKIEAMMKEYYAVRGWDWDTGKPTREKLESLGLPDVAADLWGHS